MKNINLYRLLDKIIVLGLLVSFILLQFSEITLVNRFITLCLLLVTINTVFKDN